jgi:hypothetical protein
MRDYVAIQTGSKAAFFREDGWFMRNPDDATAYDSLDEAIEEMLYKRNELRRLACRIFVAEVE